MDFNYEGVGFNPLLKTHRKIIKNKKHITFKHGIYVLDKEKNNL